jgi:hypothetical protein
MNELSTWGDIEIQYRPGIKNGNADGMSRRQPNEKTEQLEDLVKALFAIPPSEDDDVVFSDSKKLDGSRVSQIATSRNCKETNEVKHPRVYQDVTNDHDK